MNGKIVFLFPKTVETPLAEPHGSALAFLSDLHEQVEIQLLSCSDPTLRTVLQDLRMRLEVSGLIVKTAAEL